MAKMIPDLDPRMIQNDGESRVYASLRRLPNFYTVLYSYAFKTMVHGDGIRPGMDEYFRDDLALGEADFVVVHPEHGFIVIEVKQGKIGYSGGLWYEDKVAGQVPMRKNPVDQARKAMYAIIDRYKKKTGSNFAAFKARFLLWFPEASHVWGDIPAILGKDGILLERDLDRPEEALERAFGPKANGVDRGAMDALIHRVLAPAFRTFDRLDEQFERYDALAGRILTDEQERIIEETELNRRAVFFGAAGTGKTYVAVEKARRLAAEGKRVFFTCFNRNLALYLRVHLPDGVVCQNFHDFILDHLTQAGLSIEVPEEAARGAFFEETLPTHGFDYFAGATAEEKFDSIIVDEGQDFSEYWYACLQAMLRSQSDGEFYVFADPNQDLFRQNIEVLLKMNASMQTLTRNLRNVEPISDWIGTFVSSGRLRPGLRGGIPVVQQAWYTPQEERRLVETEVGRLVSQGIKPGRIVILSPNTRKNSSFAECERVKEWPLVDFSLDVSNVATGSRAGGIRFATIRSFKGLEADVVILVGLRAANHACTPADIYVGGSRARFVLYVYYKGDDPPAGIPR